MVREAAIARSTAGDPGFWFGHVELPPGMVSALHHHGRSSSGIYIVSGAARFCVGADLEEVSDAEAGDFVWVPPEVVHLEMNRSDDEPVVMAVVRSTDEAIVVNLPTPPGWQPRR